VFGNSVNGHHQFLVQRNDLQSARPEILIFFIMTAGVRLRKPTILLQ